MKRILLASCLLVLFSTSCFASDYKFYFFGIDGQWIKQSNYKLMAGGLASSLLTHVTGHYLSAELLGMHIHQHGLSEDVQGHESDSNMRWFMRSGFLAQAIIGTALTSFESTRYSSFTRGYITGSAIELFSYPVRYQEEGDFHGIDEHGGNSSVEFGLYSLVSIHNLMRIKW